MFTKYLLIGCCTAGIVPGPGDIAENKRDIETYSLVVGDKKNTDDKGYAEN